MTVTDTGPFALAVAHSEHEYIPIPFLLGVFVASGLIQSTVLGLMQ